MLEKVQWNPEEQLYLPKLAQYSNIYKMYDFGTLV